MRAAKVIFHVSWVDNHGKRFPPKPQQLVTSVDNSACSRLIVCSVRSGKFGSIESVKSMYLDPKGLLSASWAVSNALTVRPTFVFDDDNRFDAHNTVQ